MLKARMCFHKIVLYSTLDPDHPWTSIIRIRLEVNRNESRPHLKAISTLSSLNNKPAFDSCC